MKKQLLAVSHSHQPIPVKLKWLFFLVFFGLFNQGYAQAPSWAWASASSGGSSDVGNAVAKDASGNLYVTGTFDGLAISFGSITLNNPGVTQMFLVKYNSIGTPQWAVGTNCISEAAGHGVAVDGNGDVYVTGSFDDTISFGTTKLSTSGVFLAKFSSSGSLAWATAPGGTLGSGSAGKDVAVDGSGNVLVTGKYFAPLTFGTTTLNNAGVFVAKYTSAGSVTWASSGTTSNFCDVGGIALDASGAAYITGHFGPTLTFGTTVHTSVAGADVFIAKYNSSGVYQWSNATGGAGNDYGYGIATDASGSVYATGVIGTSSAAAFGSTTITTAAKTKGYLVKYSATGTATWAVGIGGTTCSVNAYNLATDASGNIYVAGGFLDGSSLTIGTNTMNNASSSPLYSEILVAKYDASGNAVWGKSAGGQYVEEAYGITVDAIGDPVITGWYNSSPLTLDLVSLTNASTTYQMFLAKLGPPCTILPAQPGAISGATSACPGSSQTYSIAAVANASSYVWSMPAGWTGTSTTNSITTTVGNTGGTITLTAINNCGTSNGQMLAVSVNPLPTPTIAKNGNILSTTTSFTTYQWYKNSTLITGATSQSYTVMQTGSYYVKVTNNSGCTGQSNTINVTSLSITTPKKTEVYVYPTVNNGTFKIRLPNGKKAGVINIFNAQGALVQRQSLNGYATEVNFEIENKVPGIYILELVYPDETYHQKIYLR